MLFCIIDTVSSITPKNVSEGLFCFSAAVITDLLLTSFRVLWSSFKFKNILFTQKLINNYYPQVLSRSKSEGFLILSLTKVQNFNLVSLRNMGPAAVLIDSWFISLTINQPIRALLVGI